MIEGKTKEAKKTKFSTGLIKPKPKLTGVLSPVKKEFKPKEKKLEETCFYMDEQFTCPKGPVSTDDGVVTCSDGTTVSSVRVHSKNVVCNSNVKNNISCNIDV